MHKEYDIDGRYANAFARNGSTGEDGDSREPVSSAVEGYEQLFDIKVDLRPVELVPVKQ